MNFVLDIKQRCVVLKWGEGGCGGGVGGGFKMLLLTVMDSASTVVTSD